MHYDILRAHERLPRHELYTALENPPHRAAPSRVQQRDHALVGRDEVYRDTVGDRDGEEQSRRAGRMAVDTVEDEPARWGRAVRAALGPRVPGMVLSHQIHGTAVNLVREHQPREARAE